MYLFATCPKSHKKNAVNAAEVRGWSGLTEVFGGAAVSPGGAGPVLAQGEPALLAPEEAPHVQAQ